MTADELRAFLTKTEGEIFSKGRWYNVVARHVYSGVYCVSLSLNP